ncbi:MULTISPECIES: LysR family transcriptional regulator [unclassified Bradyrhizobium]|uniref:LysR family transcriptional regulator n=1 Tax=unclassified Bradyrhizobium TaxID=2631580 RepID=UPI0020B3A375|nr:MULTISPECIES: LysR family transcriptional regulator [unclassified Bradyrhizobium]MCP3383166.1 LysR family transcriptional regulator [Bradyrhizobium sp. CCGUVB4N]MCP3444247.1 LysR family transcriptional regulator [Bradyrhizobium sp. CCGUVB14]
MAVSFKTLDLNLLKVFDAVMEERSVLRASQRVALSQSAVSHSLARLREMLEDDLFVRTATGMQPTARALTMAPQVREALRSLEVAVELPSFVPSASTRQFTLAANDFTTMVLASPLLKILRHEAPAVDLMIKPVTRIDLAEQIDLGRIDVAIGVFSDPPSRFRTSLLFEYDDVLIVGGKRKLGRIDNAALARMPLVVVSFGGEQEGAIGGFISERGLARRSEMYDRAALERALSESDRPPRIAVSLPHFLALPALLADSELAAIVPRPLARAFARAHAITTYELPYATTPVEVRLLWHERIAGEPSHDWLHDILRRATEDLRNERPPLEQRSPRRKGRVTR